MPYAVAWMPEAENDLSRLAPLEASYVLDQIDRLAEHPEALCSPPGFPHPEGMWKFSFWGRGDNQEVFYTVLFLRGRGSDQIIIAAIGIIRR